MEITTEMIKELRDKTNCGIMDCRNALKKADGNMELALRELRQKGLQTAAKRADRVSAEGKIQVYIHGEGRLVVVVEVNAETDFVGKSPMFQELAQELSLQIAAANPEYITDKDVPEDVLAHEKEMIEAKARLEGKSEAVMPKIVEGYMKKFYEEKVLMQQKYFRDENRTVADLFNEKVSALGENIIIRRFIRWQLGEASQNTETPEAE
ncbi:MAG: translation elongation factor Ts [Anaerolineaceae bacterium]|nr:translation elongation factor Ts [Anaerolineaceae bacterium]